MKKKASEFLKFIKHSKYNVVEQLNKLPTLISLLPLLLNFELHYKALMRVLSEAYVAHNILVEKVDQFVNNIAVGNVIAFTDDEIHLEDAKTQRLYISQSIARDIHCRELCLIMGHP